MKRVPLSSRSSTQAHVVVDDEFYDDLLVMGPWMLVPSRHTAYAVRADFGRMHRFLLGLAKDDPRVCDHIDGNGLNNQRHNLRVVSDAENRQNLRNRFGVTSRFRGVCWNKHAQRWEARARAAGTQYSAGMFADELEAAIAVQALRDEHMPFAQPDPALTAALELRSAA